MDFYTLLSQYYKELFPLDEDCAAFIGNRIQRGMTFLDAGCGSGELVIRLRKAGVDAEGFDLDPGMVEKANALAAETKESEKVFRVGDLTNLAEDYRGRSFDGLSCLGNTLVHIPFSDQIRFLEQARKLLKPGGIFFLQILNYQGILDGSLSFPLLETEHCRFEREYKGSIDPERLFFHTALTDKNSGTSYKNSITHYPILPEKMMALMSMAGYAGWETYGSWKEDPAAAGRLPLIVCGMG